MACGLALKRPLDFDPLHNSNAASNCDEALTSLAAKRRCCRLPQRCGSETSATNSSSLVAPSLWRRYASSTSTVASSFDSASQSPFTEATKTGSLSSEKIVKHIFQEYKRIKKRKLLVNPKQISQSVQANTVATSSNSIGSNHELPAIHLDRKNSHSVILPEKQTVGAPLLSIEQVGLICERLLKEQQELLCSQYEKVLINKLSEQYDAFVKFSHDQLQKQLQGRPASYVS